MLVYLRIGGISIALEGHTRRGLEERLARHCDSSRLADCDAKALLNPVFGRLAAFGV